MTRIKNVVVGSPMGFKLNEDSGVELDELINLLKVYHGGAYVVGYDTSFVDRPHYHIHWFSVKVVSEGALKTFRSTLTKKLTNLTRGDKLYTGQDLTAADGDRWIAYAIKENYVKSETIEITEQQKILAKASYENKRQNKVYSEQKANVEKEKKEFKNKVYEYVKDNLESYEIPDMYKNKVKDTDKVRLLVIKFLMEQDRTGSLKKAFIDNYVMYCNIKINNWDEFKVLGNIYIL